jgi:hypothetical protein
MNTRDITIKRCVSDFGPLTREQLIALAQREEALGAPATLWRRLLPSKPLLARKEIYVRAGAPNEKYVYADYDISRRKDCDHDLITAWAHITFYYHFDLFHWKRPREKYKGKLNEDAFFIVRVPLLDRMGEIHYYLESDTGSEGYAQIEDKLKRYCDHFEREGKAFFVLFVTLDQKRAIDLANRASRVVPEDMCNIFLFTSLDDLLANPAGLICYVPYEEDRFPIVPAP